MSEEELVFNWRHKFLDNKISVTKARAEFKRIKNVYGSLTAKNVLAASRPKKALFHKCFEWNDGIAAEKYRMQQARVLINNIQVTIVTSKDNIVDVPYYEIVKDDKGRRSYAEVTSIVTDHAYSLQIKMKAMKELEYWKAKYEVYEELSKQVEQIEEVLQLM